MKRPLLFTALPFIIVAALAAGIAATTPSASAKPCQNFDALNPAAAKSAIQLAKQYPVHSDPNQGFAEPAPERTFFDSVSCNVVFSQADRPAWTESSVRPAGYRCEGGFDYCIWLSPGPYQKIAKKGDTLRKLANWDGQGQMPVCVLDPVAKKQIFPSPDDRLSAGTIVSFC